jgi:hypothetical protein
MEGGDLRGSCESYLECNEKLIFFILLCASCSCIRSGVFVQFLHLQREPTVSLGFPATSHSSSSAYCLRFSHRHVLLIFLVRFVSDVGLLCAPPVPATGLISLRF